MMKTSYPKTSPRRRSKYFADGSALVVVKDGGIVLVESQGQYKAPGTERRSRQAASPTFAECVDRIGGIIPT